MPVMVLLISLAYKPQNTVQAENCAAKLWGVGAAWPLLLFLWRP